MFIAAPQEVDTRAANDRKQNVDGTTQTTDRLFITSNDI